MTTMAATNLGERRPLRFFSTALARNDYPEDEDVVEQNGGRDMPRLQALREKLRSEDDAAPTISQVSPNVLVDQHTNLPFEDADVDVDADANTNILTDTHGRHHNYLRISLAERCNLRCRYCMPPEGVPLQPKDDLLTHDEIIRLVKLFRRNGVDKVRLTGGEPLLREGLVDLVRDISGVLHDDGEERGRKMVGMTTNALTLSRHIRPLVDAGLTGINVSLDTLHAERYTEITRRNGLKKVLKSIDDSLDAFRDRYGSAREANGTARVKINCVVMNNFNDDELYEFVKLSNDRFHGDVDVRFIEWMPFNDNGWNRSRFLSYADMMENINTRAVEDNGGWDEAGLRRVGDGPNDTTKWWQLADPTLANATTNNTTTENAGNGGGGARVGFITSMSDHFCGTCNRLRITADGMIKTCLFGSNEREVSLRDVLRKERPPQPQLNGDVDGDNSDSEDEEGELGRIIRSAVRRKNFSLGGHGSPENIAKAANNRPMTLIGG